MTPTVQFDPAARLPVQVFAVRLNCVLLTDSVGVMAATLAELLMVTSSLDYLYRSPPGRPRRPESAASPPSARSSSSRPQSRSPPVRPSWYREYYRLPRCSPPPPANPGSHLNSENDLRRSPSTLIRSRRPGPLNATVRCRCLQISPVDSRDHRPVHA